MITVACAYQYDHVLPEVDFIGVESMVIPGGRVAIISVEAASLGRMNWSVPAMMVIHGGIIPPVSPTSALLR